LDTYAPARRTIRALPIAFLLLVAACSRAPSVSLEEVTDFGSNPGDLRMFKFVPESLIPVHSKTPAESPNGGAKASRSNVPLVVALHGCMQDAQEYGQDSGWIEQANRLGFLLLLPEQRRGNNLTGCFNWYSPDDMQRDKGEVLSIREMIDRMRQEYSIDPHRIYVTGISAGAAMTMAMAALYPDIFAGAAPVAGIPFGCADGLWSGLGCMRDPPDMEPAKWGTLVRSATSHEGPWPRLSVWQGDADSAVDPRNAEAIVRQWTDVHGIDDIADQTEETKGDLHNLYKDSQGLALVESHRIEDMGHGLAVDPGPGRNQCGKAGMFFPDVDICSSLYITRFWGLDRGR